MGQTLNAPSHQIVGSADGASTKSTDSSTPLQSQFPVSRYQLKNASFTQALKDLSGRETFESEDPRWAQLFHSEVLVEIMEHPYALSGFALQLIQNNPTTRNFVQLIEQVASTIKFTIKTKSPMPDELVPKCCTATYLLTVLLHFFCMFQTTDELRAQLGLSASWPDVTLQAPTAAKPEPKGIERLINLLVTTIAFPSDEVSDIKFFCMELLICMASAPMYRNTSDECVGEDIFMMYLYNQASMELQHSSLASLAYDPSAASQTVFSECLAVKLIKGLLQCSHGGVYIVGQSSVQPQGAEPTLIKTVQDFSAGPFLSNVQFRIISHRSGFDTEGDVIGSVSRFVVDMWRKLPLLSRLAPAHYAAPPEEIPECDPFDDELVPLQNFPIHLLKDRAVQVMLLLIHQRIVKDGQRAMNPFREVFNLLADDRLPQDQAGGDIEMVHRPGGGALAVNQIFIDFQAVIRDLAKMLPLKEYVLVLYSFLQMHSSFPEILRTSGYVPKILTACIQGLFETATMPKDEMDVDTINHMYTLVICILILVQDHAYMESVYAHTVEATYYKEIGSMELPLAEVVLLVVLKVMNICIYRMSDQYLLSNLCAIVMNICVYIHNMNAYTAERVVKNIVNMCKKVTKDEPAAAAEAAAAAAAAAAGEEPIELEHVEVVDGAARPAQAVDMELLKLGLMTLLHFTDTMLRAHVHDNLTFIYTLVSSQVHLCDYITNPKVLQFLAGDSTNEGAPDQLHHNSAASDYTQTLASLSSSMVMDSVPAIRHCADIHRVVRRHVEKIEAHSTGDDSGETVHLTPQQAMDILRADLAQTATDGDIESAAADIHTQRRNAQHKTHFSYQEAENAQDFFVPYVWTTILLSTPELPWNWDLLSSHDAEQGNEEGEGEGERQV